MYSSVKASVFALVLTEVLFMITVMGTSQDSCKTAVKALDKRLRSVEADVKAIARALNVVNPPGIKPAVLISPSWPLFFYFIEVTVALLTLSLNCLIFSYTGTTYTSCRDIYRNHKWVELHKSISIEIYSKFPFIRAASLGVKKSLKPKEKKSLISVLTKFGTRSFSLFYGC